MTSKASSTPNKVIVKEKKLTEAGRQKKLYAAAGKKVVLKPAPMSMKITQKKKASKR